MKNETAYLAAAAILSAACLLTPAFSRADSRLNITVEGTAEHCADLNVRSDGQVAQAAETFTLQKSEAPTLEVNAPERGLIRVRGWDRPEYSVEACKIAVAGDRAGADQLLQSISISRNAGRFTFTGSGSDAGEWRVYFIVHAPKDASLDLETKNGPVDVGQVSGTVKVRAANGPVSIRDSSGAIQANTINGPISFAGGGGDVRLNAQNGPISLKLEGEAWNGAQLAATTVNGPVSLVLPERFRSGVRVDSAHGPISCRAGACPGAWTNTGADRRTLQLNGAGNTVTVTTEHGPVSVSGGPKSSRAI
jgi:hypothetical protein